MKVHLYASARHYREHIVAVWKHLPEELQGREFTNPRLIPKEAAVDDVFMVAGRLDIDDVPNHRIVFVEHGAGQRYDGLREKHQEHYHGSRHPNRVIAYIAPRQEVADSWGRPAFAAGAPVCDPYQLFGEEGVVAITFHWDAPNVCSETRSAFDHYVERMPDIVTALRKQGYEVLGHHHPSNTVVRDAWKLWDVPVVDVDTVRTRASILIADNTSLLYEMAYLYRGTVALNAPWYRRDVEHGLRFWNWYGLMIDEPDDLIDWFSEERHFTPCVDGIPDAKQAYGRVFSDGADGLRAGSWLTSFLAGV